MSIRLNHFMTVGMLNSQLATLEPPEADEADDCETVQLADENGIPKNPAWVADDAEAAINKLLNMCAPLLFHSTRRQTILIPLRTQSSEDPGCRTYPSTP